jgi:cell wall-associated NlpC family hydrolase
VTNGRTRAARALAIFCISGLGAAALTSGPSAADPSIGDVQERVDRLYHEAQEASERYNQARIELTEARQRLRSVQEGLARQRGMVEAVRDQVVSNVVTQYQGGYLSSTQLLLTDDPDAFIAKMTTMSEYNAQQASVVDELALRVDRLEAREEAVHRALDTITRTRAQLAEEKALIEERAAEAEALLGRLREQAAQERERRLSRSEGRLTTSPSTTTPTAPASGGAAAAVGYALAQVGDAYVYGAAGPSAFDCSGLTMMAWAQAGVSLPHSSSAQMGSGTPVSTSSLQPGDLVFYYSPVSHVGIYIGNGQIVHASNPSAPVGVAAVGSMPISGAVRPG